MSTTESGLDDFSHFYPAISHGNISSTIHHDHPGLSSGHHHYSPTTNRARPSSSSSRHHDNRNSLPSISPIDCQPKDMKKSEHIKRFSSPIDSPMYHLISLQKELDSLKDSVWLSPSHSPDLTLFETPPETSRPPPLIVEEPFTILSDNIIFPLEEYSVQVPPFYHPQSDIEPSFLSSEDISLPIKRQGSYEYDHLETISESSRKCQSNNFIKDEYIVAVQFSKEENKEKTSTLTTLADIEVSSRKNSTVSSPGSHKEYSSLKSSPRNIPSNNRLSSSIPNGLNSFSTLSDINRCREDNLHIWNSTSKLTRKEQICCCPSCCSCRSNKRRSNSAHHLCPLRSYNKLTHIGTSSPLIRRELKQYEISKDPDEISKDPEKISKDPDEISKGPDEISKDPVKISKGQEVGVVYPYDDAESIWSGQSVSTCYDREHISYNVGVNVNVFKERSDLMTEWFNEFSDQQRNTLLLKLIDKCNCSQMHILSLQMEPILHQGCPHNCQDLLSWLPPIISLRILSYLDPISLCRVSEVSRSWYGLANDIKLWELLCMSQTWQLSPSGLSKLKSTFTAVDGVIEWKMMFIEMFRLRRNWLKGYCTVRTFEGHSQGISCVQFDDTRIVSGSWDKTIKVWNRRTNTAWAALTLAGHSGTVRCLHLYGNRLVSGSSDRTIKVWDLATNNVGWLGATCRATMIGHQHTVRCLQADDSKVLSGSYDHTVKVWDITSGQCTMTLRGHTDAVLCLQFDDTKVLSGSKDTTIKLWRLDDGSCQLTLHGHEGAVTCLQFDDSRIISGALDRLIKIWDIITGQCVFTMDWIKSEGHTGVVRHLQADSWKIVSAADDKTLKVWSVGNGERLLTLKSHTDGVTCLQFNDQVIVSGSYDKTVKLWDFSVC